MLASHDVSLVREPGELGRLPSHLAVRHLPSRLAARLLRRASEVSLARCLRPLNRSRCSRMMLQGVQRCLTLDPPSPRGAGLSGDPGPFDRYLLLTDSVFRDDSPSLDARRIAFSPRDTGARDSRRGSSLRRADRRAGECSSPTPSCQRASDASSPGGLPQRSLRPPASARDRVSDLGSNPTA
jgi:hypothetical protein